MKRIFLLFTLYLVLLPQGARAQAGAKLFLRYLSIETFPQVTGYLDARDATGARIIDLVPDDLQVIEDGAPQPVQQLRTAQPGLRVILVLNPAESFAIHDSQGLTRFDYVKQAIQAWTAVLSSTSDTLLSLVAPEGVLARDSLAGDWLATLDTYQPNLSPQVVNIETLPQALDLAAQPPPEPGMGTAIWWITATPRSESLAALPEWQTTLIEQGIQLFIWQLDSASNFSSPAAQSLQALAQASGGQMFNFSGTEIFPEPEDYFDPLRSAYFFQYASQLRTAGEHGVVVQLQREGATVSSQPYAFTLDLLAPSPILVSPPTQIQRGPSQEDPRQLAPFSQPIDIEVQFPDNFERNLVRTTLYVNEEPVAENSSAPFTHFAWDLSGYTLSAQVSLRVEAEDELDLIGSSIDFPVQISVQAPPSWFQVLLARGAPALAFAVLLIAAGAFLLVMVLSGRINPSQLAFSKILKRSRPVPRPSDPLLDSPLPSSEAEQSSAAAKPFAFSKSLQPAEDIRAPAYLQSLTMQDPNHPAPMLPLEYGDLLIGADRSCDLILKDDSVAAQHARLSRREDGEYHLSDLGSEAGTWVNYAPLSAGGSHLQDGDLVHIGRVPFRFLLNISSNGSAASSPSE